jgi:predicted nucleotidyltransferase
MRPVPISMSFFSMPMCPATNHKNEKKESLTPETHGLIAAVLSKDERVLFAYLYGSFGETGKGNDIDIAIYAKETDFHKLSADLKIALYQETGISADRFDIQILNGLLENGDIFSLLYLKNILTTNLILVDRNRAVRTDFVDRYGTRFRECEGLMQELLI